MLTYTNIYQTNYYGTNIVTTFVTTNGTFTTNITLQHVMASNYFTYYTWQPGYKTNSTTQRLYQHGDHHHRVGHRTAIQSPLIPPPTQPQSHDISGADKRAAL